MPRALVADAQRLGFRLEPAAARILVDRMGANPVRLQHELERLALWAGEGGEVTAADLDAMIADTSEAAVWSLSDALLERDAATALRIGERLIDQGENVTGLIYGLASRLRERLRRRRPAGGGRPAQAGRVRAEDAPLRRQAAGRPPARHRRRRPAHGDRGPGRPGALVPRRRRLRRRAGAHPAPLQASEPRAGASVLHTTDATPRCAVQPRRCGRLWTSCGRRCSCAWRPSARPCRSSRRGRAPRLAIALASPPSTALSSRRKWVFTVLVSSRFSARSRSLRRIRFFCEAMLAMVECPSGRRAGSGRPPTIATETRPAWRRPRHPTPPRTTSGRRSTPTRPCARPRPSIPARNSPAEPAPGRQAGRIARSTAFFSIATAASRVAGLVPRSRRRRLLRHQRADVGLHDRLPGPEPDPRLFADAALQPAFVPVFTELLGKKATTARPSGSPRPCCCW